MRRWSPDSVPKSAGRRPDRRTISDERVWGVGGPDHPPGDRAGVETMGPEINRLRARVSPSETIDLKRFASLRSVSDGRDARTGGPAQRGGGRPEWPELGADSGWLTGVPGAWIDGRAWFLLASSKKNASKWAVRDFCRTKSARDTR